MSFRAGTVARRAGRLSSQEKLELVTTLWPTSRFLQSNFVEEHYDAFFDFVYEENMSLQRDPPAFAAQTLETTIGLVEELNKHCRDSRNEIISSIKENFLNMSDSAVLRSLELACRIWLTLNIRSESAIVGRIQAFVNAIEWPECETLKHLVQDQFVRHEREDSAIQQRIDPAFTAAYLANKCGIKIHWTNNLADHLRFERTGRLVLIYQHKICLLNHSESSNEPIVPRDVLDESIDTLNLLFPFPDSDTKTLLSKHDKTFYNLGLCGRDRILDITCYPYWGERLIELLTAFNEPPREFRRLISDRRNMNEWANLRIGMLVLLLTIFGIVYGIVSMVFTIKQYKLALAQACIQPDVAKSLLKFCG